MPRPTIGGGVRANPPAGWAECQGPSKLWRYGRVFHWSPVFGRWVDRLDQQVSIRPGELARQAYYRKTGEELPRDAEIFLPAGLS